MSKQNIFFLLLLAGFQLNGQNTAETVGIVNGQRITWGDFLHYEQLVYTDLSVNRYQVRTQVWDYFVESALVRQEASRIGLDVPEEEMEDLQFGYNLSPIIQQRYRLENGQVDFVVLQEIRHAIASGTFPPDYQAYWTVQKAEIEKDRLQSKMTALLTKGCYTPAWQAEMAWRDANEKIEIQYVRIPYDKIPDQEALPDDADLNAFLDQFPRLYHRAEESRLLDYWLFPVVPSAADSAAVRAELEALRPAFQATANDSLFIAAHNGVMNGEFYRRTDLHPTVTDQPQTQVYTISSTPQEPAMPLEVVKRLFKVKTGRVVGPFFDGRGWAITKVLERRVLPDSVRARHILLRTDQVSGTERGVDELLAQLRSGVADFAELAKVYSMDPGTSQRGGDLGWISKGRTVPEFDALCFVYGKPGRFYKVKTQFGWHLVEITGQKFLTKEKRVRLAIIYRDVFASPETEQKTRAHAEQIFVAASDLQALQALAEWEGIALTQSNPLQINDFSLADLRDPENIRRVVRDAFAPEVAPGQVWGFSFVRAEFPVVSHFAIFGLRQIIPRGPASPETLRSFPGAVLQVAQGKKTAMVAAGTKDAGSLSSIAAQWSVAVETTSCRFMDPHIVMPDNTNVTYPVTYHVSPVGDPFSYQPYPDPVWSYAGGGSSGLVGRAFALGNNELSGPIAGHDGIYFLQKTGFTVAAQATNLSMFRRQASLVAAGNVRANWLRDMRNRANIEDFRSRFF